MKALLLLACMYLCLTLQAQQVKDTSPDSLLITVILKHQQDKNLKQIQEIQNTNKYWETFPPKVTRVVSWYAVMGLGQVITLMVAPGDVRTLNLSVGNAAWGAFSTEIYPSYDYVPIWKDHLKDAKK